ncbi:outer membrane lipoprotein carrier protein LolA [bacterium]|nr:outer membrane lipoprotein carrier protein LolA [bacterium]
MKVKLLSAICLCVAIISFFGSTNEKKSDVDHILSKVEENQNMMKTMEANISQTIFMQGQTITSNGKIYIKKPDLMRMDIISPKKLTTIMNDKEKMMYMKLEDGQVIKQRMPDTGEFSNMNFTFNHEEMEEKYIIREIGAKSDIRTIELSPKNEKDTMRIELQIDIGKGVIVKSMSKDVINHIEINVEFSDLQQIDGRYWIAKTIITNAKVEENSIKTIIIYSNLKINEDLKDSLFKYNTLNGGS